jgi:hypothetical protein
VVVPVDHIGAADPIGASNTRNTALRRGSPNLDATMPTWVAQPNEPSINTALCRGSLNLDATMPTWVAQPNEPSMSNKEYDSEVVGWPG